MAFHLYEDTWETTTTTGTGAKTLAGAVSGWRAFSAQYANGDTLWYSMFDGTNFEMGLGTFASSANTITPTTVYRSTNANAAVSWGAGVKQITVSPLGVVLETLFTPGQTGYPHRTADNTWAFTASVVTSVTAGTGLSGGTITGTGTIGLVTTVGAVGTDAFLYQISGGYGPGANLAGSSLKYAGVNQSTYGGAVLQISGSSPSGTWQCMGYTSTFSCCCTGYGSATTWRRIA